MIDWETKRDDANQVFWVLYTILLSLMIVGMYVVIEL